MKISNITPAVSTSYTVGAILLDQWGNEQTNVQFYCIVKVAEEWITILPMNKICSPLSDSLERTNMPGEIDLTATPIRKKLKSYQGEVTGFSFRTGNDGGWCRLWKGDVKISSHYK